MVFLQFYQNLNHFPRLLKSMKVSIGGRGGNVSAVLMSCSTRFFLKYSYNLEAFLPNRCWVNKKATRDRKPVRLKSWATVDKRLGEEQLHYNHNFFSANQNPQKTWSNPWDGVKKKGGRGRREGGESISLHLILIPAVEVLEWIIHKCSNHHPLSLDWSVAKS